MQCRGSEVLREVAWVIFDEVSYILCCLAGILSLQQGLCARLPCLSDLARLRLTLKSAML